MILFSRNWLSFFFRICNKATILAVLHLVQNEHDERVGMLYLAMKMEYTNIIRYTIINFALPPSWNTCHVKKIKTS